MDITERIERCHSCKYYQRYKHCEVRDIDDIWNKVCMDYKRIAKKRRARK